MYPQTSGAKPKKPLRWSDYGMVAVGKNTRENVWKVLILFLPPLLYISFFYALVGNEFKIKQQRFGSHGSLVKEKCMHSNGKCK
jgi:hypothetical protein